MNRSDYPRAVVLSKFLLIQNMLGQFSDNKTLIEFVLKGLLEIPGIINTNYIPFKDLNSEAIPNSGEYFKISIKNKIYGKLFIEYNSKEEIKPYLPYIQNLCFMIAVIFEEKHQREINNRYQQDLENMVRERTALLSSEIEERINAEQKLIDAKKRAEEYLRISEAIIVELDTNGNIQNINDHGCKLLEYSKKELIGRNWVKTFIPDSQRDEVQQVFNDIVLKKQPINEYYENNIKDRNGNLHDIAWHNTIKKDSSNKIIGTLSSGIDITTNKQMMDYLQKSERLESLGILAGGIAHDFNNLLEGLFGYLDLSLEISEPGSEIHTYLAKAMSVYNRTKNLTQQLLTFSKGGSPFLKTGSIEDLITNSIDFALSGSKVKSRYIFQKDLWSCDFDGNQLSQVFDNLTINSIHAMPSGGEINISAKNIALTDSNILDLTPGKYVKIIFSDKGLGIPKEIISKIFDPFVTTKKMGSGLGLATSYSIIIKHKGTISVDSKLNEGTTFTIYLPASQKEISDQNSESEYLATYTGKGNILVMDDEEFILEILHSMLESFGFNAETVPNGEQALKKISDEKEYKAIILDLTIPNGLGGKDIIQRIKEVCKGTPVFASSGYYNDPVMADPQKFGFTNCLKKPFRKKDLKDVLEMYL